MQRVNPKSSIGRILEWSQQQQATDLHGQTGRPYAIRVHGKLSWVPIELFPPPGEEELNEYLRQDFDPEICRKIEQEREVDLSFTFGVNRYRANFSKQRGQQSFSFRIVPQQ